MELESNSCKPNANDQNDDSDSYELISFSAITQNLNIGINFSILFHLPLFEVLPTPRAYHLETQIVVLVTDFIEVTFEHFIAKNAP